ncbi:MAG: redox-sensing transcriptional repressor Rex [Gracilibacteraceae bacterium]|nr:redox-sensing transcriptional repressor Rex [Gracilibacteraceae bacterium]
MKETPISLPAYNRLTRYLNYLQQLPEGGPLNVSAAGIAAELALSDIQVRKDLAAVSRGGRPRVGYVTRELVADLEHFLGRDNSSDAALVGAGHLGQALLSYENFASYGLKIVVAFDNDPRLIGRTINGKAVMDAAKMANLCRRLSIRIGIITVPSAFAQGVCDTLIAGGILAVWNFAPVNLKTPERIVVKNEDMAASLAVLTKRMRLDQPL